MKKNVRVFAPGTVANMGCGFDVMGMTLNGVGDIVSVSVSEGDGLSIENRSSVELPSDLDKNVITPAVRALMKEFGEPRMIEVVVEHKISPGSGIGSSAASSAAAVYALRSAEPLGSPKVRSTACSRTSACRNDKKHNRRNPGPAASLPEGP